MKNNPETAPPFAFEGLSRIIHEKARLGIMTALFNHSEGYGFMDLKSLCGLSDGNLSRHLKVLTDHGYLEIWKSFKENKPNTHCRLTEKGRKAFLEYLQTLERVLISAQKS